MTGLKIWFLFIEIVRSSFYIRAIILVIYCVASRRSVLRFLSDNFEHDLSTKHRYLSALQSDRISKDFILTLGEVVCGRDGASGSWRGRRLIVEQEEDCWLAGEMERPLFGNLCCGWFGVVPLLDCVMD